jgi:hypothetical protein
MILGEWVARASLVPLLVALAACSGGSSAGAPPSSPSVTSAPATSAATSAPVTPSVSSGTTASSLSASAAVPVLPEAAKHPTSDGAVAFVAYFIAVYDYTFDSLDVTMITAIAGPKCGFCRDTIQAANAARSQSVRYSGGHSTIRASVAAPGDPKVGVLVNALLDQAESTELDGEGNVLKRVPATPNQSLEAVVAWNGFGWQAVGVVVRKAVK